MTQEEIKQYLAQNLKIAFSTQSESYREYPVVSLILEGETISQATCYEMEINQNS